MLYEDKPEGYYRAVKRVVLSHLPDGDLGDVFDVGGGEGATAAFLIENHRARSALVMDPYSVSKDQGNLCFSRESADDLEVFDRMASEGAEFDTIMFLDVLEHLLDPWGTLAAVRSVHRDGGKLVVCMPNARFVALVVPLVLRGRFDYKASGIMDRTHIRWFTRATTIELIEGAGYKIEKINAFVEPRVSTINWLTLGIFRRFFEYQYIVQATKLG